MHKKLMVVVGLIVLLSVAALPVVAQDKVEGVKYEYAVVKWDGPDRLYYNLPTKFELVHLKSQGVNIPKDAQEEEWCLAYAANQLGKEGWEAVNLNSRRILLRRVRR